MESAQKKKGFTFIELMIAVLIASILAAIAFPAFQSFLRKGKRVDGVTSLLSVQSAQEKFRANNLLYGTLAQVWGGNVTSPDGRYNLQVTNITGTSYTLTATAIGDQLKDAENGTSCGTLSLAVNGINETRTPVVCWN